MPTGTKDLLADLARFGAISLDELDARAALQERVDHKYLVPAAAVSDALEALRDDHQALEIDSSRAFRYESVYFDTPRLDCFRAHVEDRRPRYKARTRLYADSGQCAFEVKLKRADGETVKESREHDPDERHHLTDAARELLAQVLGSAPAGLAPTLVTRFRRATLGHATEAERVTIDVGLELVRPDGERARLREPCAIVETKTRTGEGRCDTQLRELGYEPISLSKYRTGVGLLCPDDADPPSPDPQPLFSAQRS